MLLVLPAATSYITRDYIIKFYYSLTNRLIPYPTFMQAAFQCYRPYELSLSYFFTLVVDVQISLDM